MLKRMQNISLLLATLLIAGCLYVPTHEHGESIVTDEAINFLVPHKTTRADVLLRLGDPIQKLEEDRYFIYHWKTTIAYLIVFGFYSADVAPDSNLHYVCLEFTPEHLLKRWKHFEEGYLQLDTEKQIIEWMEEDSNL
jgi:hypothetical protein